MATPDRDQNGCAVPPMTVGHTGLIPIHPERTDDPATLRWHAGGQTTVPDGLADRATAALRDLVEAGVLSGYTVAGDLTTTLASGLDWAAAGPRVRAAVRTTLHAARTGEGLDAVGRDTALSEVARQVITEIVEPAAAGHGGSVDLVSVADGVVTVRMAGSCHGCPAAGVTLHAGLEKALRAQAPWLREVKTEPERARTAGTGRSFLGGIGRRRGQDAAQAAPAGQ